LVEATNTGYLILDMDGKVVDANQEYVRLSGHSKLREIIERSVIEWTADYEKQKNADAIKQCLRDGFIKGLVIDYVDQSGLITPVEINAAVIGAGDDNLALP
jgi:PAS domain S-box-containing protein